MKSGLGQEQITVFRRRREMHAWHFALLKKHRGSISGSHMWPFKSKTKPGPFKAKPLSGQVDVTPDRPRPFGYKTTWWAVRSTDTDFIARKIGLENSMPCNWNSGIPLSYENHVFVTPPVKDWTFITGFNLPPSDTNPENECLSQLLMLSSQFGEAQFFSTHRIVEYHVWARAIAGALVRGFGYLDESGEYFWDIGDSTAEHELGFKFSRFENLDDDSHMDDADFPSEEHVMEVAGLWSIAPTDLDQYSKIGVGLIGTALNWPSPSNAG